MIIDTIMHTGDNIRLFRIFTKYFNTVIFRIKIANYELRIATCKGLSKLKYLFPVFVFVNKAVILFCLKFSLIMLFCA